VGAIPAIATLVAAANIGSGSYRGSVLDRAIDSIATAAALSVFLKTLSE
jgi:hypothetical protein